MPTIPRIVYFETVYGLKITALCSFVKLIAAIKLIRASWTKLTFIVQYCVLLLSVVPLTPTMQGVFECSLIL